MKITDEMAEAARRAWYVAIGPHGITEWHKVIAAVAPLIAQEAAKEIADQKDKAASLLRALSYEREINALNVAHIEAQAKEIAELKAALGSVEAGVNMLHRAIADRDPTRELMLRASDLAAECSRAAS